MYSRFAILSCLLITVLRQKHICAVSIGKKEVLTLATVTDIHIGENCHGDLTFNGCKPIRALTDAINKINSMADIDGVFVTGDLTASVKYFKPKRQYFVYLIHHPLLGFVRGI